MTRPEHLHPTTKKATITMAQANAAVVQYRDQVSAAAPAMLRALLAMRPFVAMFRGRLDEIDAALALAGHPQPPVETSGPPQSGQRAA